MTKGFKLMGLRLDGTTRNAEGRSTHDCGALWQRFHGQKIIDRIPGRLSDAVYAVYFDYEGSEDSPFSYFIGCKTEREAIAPEGLHELVIPDQTYLHFVARGEIPASITAVWQEIWGSGFKRNFGYDFEVYDDRSLDGSDAIVDIFVSVLVSRNT
jgi:predicted transcriptional regulator YdeE